MNRCKIDIRMMSCVTIICFLLLSCINGKTYYRKIVGKELTCDSLLLYKGREYSVVSDSIFEGISVVLWVDSTKCSKCELKHLINYNSFDNNCKQIIGKGSGLIVIMSLSEHFGFDKMIDEIRYLNHSFDVMIDYKNTISSLLDCNERLLMVVKDRRIEECYRMDNTKGDAYRMNDCLDFLKGICN